MASKSENKKQDVTIAVMATDIGYIKESIKGIQNTLTIMDNSYVKKEDLAPIEKDHETRIRRLEVWGFMAIGALGLIEFLFKFFK